MVVAFDLVAFIIENNAAFTLTLPFTVAVDERMDGPGPSIDGHKKMS